MIRFEHVSFRYAAQSPLALDDVSLSVEPGRCIALLGANGSGKSTAVRLTNGLLLPWSGSVKVDALDTAVHRSVREIRRAVGIVFQRPDDQIVATAVEDDVAFGPENLGLECGEIRERVDAALDQVGLRGFERREPHLLSGGQKQRLAIAGALAMRPSYLVLDEPTSMLDPVGRAEVLAIIEGLRSRGVGVLHVTHDIDAVSRADRAVVLHRGRVVFEGGMPELMSEHTQLARWGLAAPPLSELSRILGQRGAPMMPAGSSADQVVDALCR